MKRFLVKNRKTLKEFVSESLKISKNKAKELIDSKNVFVNDRRIWMANHQLKSGDVVEINLEDERLVKNPQIVYEDDHIIGVNKPPFVVSDREDRSLESILRKYFNDESIKAIHRLDMETSGVLLFAKGEDVYERFKSLWEEKDIKKIYLAISHNEAEFSFKRVDRDIDGKEAISEIKLIRKSNGLSYFEVATLTGRKHQIRIHLSSIRHPIVGDKVYGPKKIEHNLIKRVKRHMLHAYKIEFYHPFTKEKMIIRADIPQDFRNILHYFK